MDLSQEIRVGGARRRQQVKDDAGVPTRAPHATLVDLLDRILDRGLVIHADLIISVAGIPLIGVTLQAALAGMETMLQYGVMQAWDEKTRAWEREQRNRREKALTAGEEILLKMHGSYYSRKGIYTAWRYGTLHLTDTRLFLYYRDFDELIFQTPLEEIQGLAGQEMARPVARGTREELILLLRDGKVVRLHAQDVRGLKAALEQQMATRGLPLEILHEIPGLQDGPAAALPEGEEVICQGVIWHQVSQGGILGETWRRGHLFLTERGLYWWNDFDQRVTFELPLEKIMAVVRETRSAGLLLKRRGMLDVVFGVNGTRKVAAFSGEETEAWERILTALLRKRGSLPADQILQTCPRCGEEGPEKELLEQGCSSCGWVSPRQTHPRVPLEGQKA